MECISCNKKESDELEFSRILGDDICEECRDEHTRYCCDCDEPCWREDMVENGNGDLVCSSCFEENYSVCCCCEEIMPNDDTYFNWSDEPYCHTCYYEYYSVCDDCECEVNNEYANHNEDGGVYCDNCYSEREVDLAMLPPRPTNTISETYDNNPYKRQICFSFLVV